MRKIGWLEVGMELKIRKIFNFSFELYFDLIVAELFIIYIFI